jgi:hypothetical protein
LLFGKLAAILEHQEIPFPRNDLIGLAELEGHGGLAHPRNQLLQHHELVMTGSIRSRHSGSEIQQGQWRSPCSLAGEAVAQAELGAALRRNHLAALDSQSLVAQQPLARFKS